MRFVTNVWKLKEKQSDYLVLPLHTIENITIHETVDLAWKNSKYYLYLNVACWYIVGKNKSYLQIK